MGYKGTNTIAFTLRKGFRPAAVVYIPVDLCNANKGRLYIQPDGVVHVSAEIRFSDAACLTSLDGATFATSAKSFTALRLKNGWRSYGSGTYKPAVRVTSGIVQFEGAIETSANNGRLYIQRDGVVEMYAQGGTEANSQCFTSLDGAWFER